jgi:hypothetical protein
MEAARVLAAQYDRKTFHPTEARALWIAMYDAAPDSAAPPTARERCTYCDDDAVGAVLRPRPIPVCESHAQAIELERRFDPAAAQADAPEGEK